MLEELESNGELKKGYQGCVKHNLDIAIAALAESNAFFAGLQERMPPTSDKLYNDIYNKVRTFTS